MPDGIRPGRPFTTTGPNTTPCPAKRLMTGPRTSELLPLTVRPLAPGRPNLHKMYLPSEVRRAAGRAGTIVPTVHRPGRTFAAGPGSYSPTALQKGEGAALTQRHAGGLLVRARACETARSILFAPLE